MCRLRRRAILGVVAVVWGLGLVAAGYAAPAKALYVRLALPPTGQKTMLLKFRGERNSPVRSVLVADRNLNGVLEPSEAVRGRAQSEAPTGYTFLDFESVRPRPELTGGIAWSIGFAHY